jgi:hypothetical protein
MSRDGRALSSVYFLPPTLLGAFSSALAHALSFSRPVGWADRAVRCFTRESNKAVAAAVDA